MPRTFHQTLPFLAVVMLLVGCASGADHRQVPSSGPRASASAPPDPGAPSPAASSTTPSASSRPPDEGSVFSVLTYNVYVGNDDVVGAARVVREADATVVCLQETFGASQQVLRAELASAYPHIAFYVGKVGNGPGVLSKVPLVDGRYVPSSHGYNGYWVGKLTLHGRQVQLANVHLHPTVPLGGLRGALRGWADAEAIRAAEIDEVVALLDPALPAVLAGDFNTPSSSASYDRVIHHGFTDAFREGDAPPRGTPTFRGKLRGLPLPVRIDYVFLRGGLHALRSRVIEGSASDHLPVHTTVH